MLYFFLSFIPRQKISVSTTFFKPHSSFWNFSIQIWPKDKALAMPAGPMRTEPNTNPYLPPPVGRMKFTL